ncbi:helix-turn-helix domain-containing protein [Phascolarctobacterium succinatutens]|uniref:helix-turn-helix domain-containing protein n=1 Tax=Phascolarctobacterium succinatutens TaxID=626940 RepID=UPI0034C6209E
MSGVTQSTVNNIVSVRNRSATVSTIKKLCNVLGITIEDFFNSELFRDLEQEIQQKMWLRHFLNSLNIDVHSEQNLILYFISRHCILSL